MDWKDLTNTIGKVAPALGTLIGGPAGAAIGAIVSSALGVANDPEAISDAVKNNPDAVIKLKEIELEHAAKIQGMLFDQAKAEIDLEKETTIEVNKSIQAEAGSEHWQTYSWRPFIGFAVGFNIIVSSILVLIVFIPAIFGSAVSATAVANLPTILGSLAAINGTTLPILGIASYFRGKMQADPAIPPPNQLQRK